MRMSLMLPLAAALAAAAIGIPSPAAATTLKEALKICNERGNCSVDGRNGGVNITVGNNQIWCPHGGGQCVCTLCAPPLRAQSAGTGVKVTPGSVLSSPSGGAGTWTSTGGVLAPKSGNAVPRTKHKPEPKPAPTAEPKPKSEPTPTPTAEPTPPPARNARDHRVTPKVGDDRSSPGVKTTRYGYEGAVKATGTGPSDKRKPKIIDHRGVDPATRSGPSEARKPKIIDHRSSSVQSKNGGSGGGGGNICGATGNPPCRPQ